MTLGLEKCSVCGGLIDEEDLFCSNCGTEAPETDQTRTALASQVSTHNFVCDGCGASMSYDASARTLRCPFCSSTRLTQHADAQSIAPQRIVRFVVDHQRASATLRQWLGRGFWRPGDLASAAEVTKVAAVYVPYWVFRARTHTYWTADSSNVPVGARGDWVPVVGEHYGEYEGLLIGASGVLTPRETADLCPFDLTLAEPAGNVNTENMIVEQFCVQRKYARPLARQSLENLDRQACQQYVPGRCRNLKVNVLLEGMSSEPLLLPVWIMAYRYRDRVFRFLVNGQTGQAAGQAPVSWKKILGAVAIAGMVGLLLCLALGIAGGL
jgi:DNA-directed RNA polymerase subunit RPC12/RpoP